MREKGQVGQVICSCGRVAELRTRANGQRLPFLMCKHCGMRQGKAELRAKWLENEDPTCSLGEFGQFPNESSNKTSENAEPEQMTTSNEHQTDWKPPVELEPENIEPKQDEEPENPKETSNSSMGLLPKVGLGLLTAVAFAFGVKKLNLANKIKG